jgi:hypothetical protein
LTTSDNSGIDSFELECREFGKTKIKVNDGILYFAKKQSSESIIKGNNEKPDCQQEISKFSGLTKNYTYTIDSECTSQLGILSNNNGVKCRVRKSVLKSVLFKIDLVVLKANIRSVISIIIFKFYEIIRKKENCET